MNILNEITNLLPVREGSLFDEKHIGKGEAQKGITECQKFEYEMFCWKLKRLFISSSIILTYSAHTMSLGKQIIKTLCLYDAT